MELLKEGTFENAGTNMFSLEVGATYVLKRPNYISVLICERIGPEICFKEVQTGNDLLVNSEEVLRGFIGQIPLTLVTRAPSVSDDRPFVISDMIMVAASR